MLISLLFHSSNTAVVGVDLVDADSSTEASVADPVNAVSSIGEADPVDADSSSEGAGLMDAYTSPKAADPVGTNHNDTSSLSSEESSIEETLLAAVYNGDITTFMEILGNKDHHNLNLEYTDSNGNTPLRAAIQEGYSGKV